MGRGLTENGVVSWFAGSCILILDPDRFDLTIGGRRRLFSCIRTSIQLFQDIVTYSRLPFSCRLLFRTTTTYLTHRNTLIYCT